MDRYYSSTFQTFPLLKLTIAITLLLLSNMLTAQDSTILELPAKYISQVDSKINSIEQLLDKKTEKVLKAVQNQDFKIYRKLLKKDSTKAEAFLQTTIRKFTDLEAKLKGATKGQYVPYLDTLKSSLNFLSNNSKLLESIKGNKEVQSALTNLKGLETSFSQAESLKSFLKERRSYFEEQLNGLGFIQELKKANKEFYYYSAQIKEYKEILKDKKKLEQKAFQLLTGCKPFQEFMQKHSELASIFNLGGNGNTSTNGMGSIAGLQTSQQVNSIIQARMGTGGQAASNLIRANMQEAQGQLSTLKDLISNQGASSTDEEFPNFKPNSQKTKSFWKRLEIGTNFQTRKARFSFPVTSDLGISVGYKLNDKSIIGIGASYNIGLGSSWNDIKISHQGVGLRSFIDYKIKGNFFMSGGYERNYQSEFKKIQQLKDYSAWQKSGLIGITKKYKVSNKVNGKMQLYYDFMHRKNIAHSSPILFRIGYNLSK